MLRNKTDTADARAILTAAQQPDAAVKTEIQQSVLALHLPPALATLDAPLPAVLIDSLREQWARVQRLDAEIAIIEQRLASILKETPQCQSVAAIPAVGLLTATAAVASIGDARTFKSGQEFAA